MFIYIVKEEKTSRYKIGRSADPQRRMSDLQVGNSSRIRMIACWESSPDVEHRIHDVFDEYRLVGEWFLLSADLILSLLPQLLEACEHEAFGPVAPTDPVRGFARDTLKKVNRPVDGTKITSLHNAYKEWCALSEEVPVGRKEFKTRLRHAGFFVLGKGPGGRDRWNAKILSPEKYP